MLFFAYKKGCEEKKQRSLFDFDGLNAPAT